MHTHRIAFDADVIESSHRIPVVVALWSPDDAGSRRMHALLERFEAEFAGAFKLVDINSSAEPEIAAAFEATRLPEVVVFHDGVPVSGFAGPRSAQAVDAFLRQHTTDPMARLLRRFHEACAEKRHPEAIDTGRALLAINPANATIRVHYAGQLVQAGRTTDARRVLSALASHADLPSPVARLADHVEQWLQAHESVARQSADLTTDGAQMLARGDTALVRGDWLTALEAYLELVQYDRSFMDDIGRRRMVAAFELCPSPKLVAHFRRCLGATLAR